MALEATFIAPDGYETSATALRQLVQDAFGNYGGRVRGFTLTPSAPEAGLALDVAAGSAVLKGTAAGQGAYYIANEETETISWPAASGQPRYDSLVLVAADSDYGSIPASVGPIWRVIQGTPAASPVKLS